MVLRNQLRLGAACFASLFALAWGGLVGQSFGQTFTGIPGTAITNAVINFSNLVTNAPVSVPGTNLTSSPPAITFEAQDDGGTQDPPFPGGAIGPNHVVSTLDNSIRIQKRDGTVLSTITLQTFWAAVGPYVDPRGAFDPKVLYDPFSGRWIMTAVADFEQPTSSTLVGVSQTTDPTGNWNLYRIAADSNGTFWVNYPTFGFNTNWIAVSETAFTIGNGPEESRLYIFDKADMYAGGAGHYTEFASTNESIFGVVEQPAATYDNTQTNLYLLAAINGNVGGNGLLQMFFVDGPVRSEVLHVGPQISVADPWDDRSPAFDFAPQQGTSQLIGLDDSRLSEAVYRNGAIWFAHTIFLPTGGAATRSAIQWWQIGTDGTVLQRGRLDDPTGNLFYGYPSIAVNQNNDALIGYARFSASNFPSAYFAFRAGTDPTNTLQGEILLKAGETPFERSDRWGDHTSTVVDPMNDLDMWTIQEYSATPINGTSLWGTWWGDVLVGPHVIASNAVVVSESCSPNNGVIDPFEHVAVRFSLLNIGSQDATNVVATLLATGGVTLPAIPHSFGTIVAGGSTNTAVLSFLADTSCGSNIVATLQLQSGPVDLGTVSFRLPVGTPNGVFTQNFDLVTAPALPSDWSTVGSGALSGWITTNANADTGPNAAFCPDTNDLAEAQLISPSIPITSSNAKMVFRNNYDLVLGFDGGVLEIAIGGGAFEDILVAGGSFEQGGYSEFINTNASSSLVDLPAWSGNSGGWITTTVDLPAAAAGKNVQLRWRCVTAGSGGGNGWLIDSVEVNDGGICCTAGSEADLAISKSASPSPVLVGSNTTYTITVTNAGPGVAFSVIVTDTLPSSVGYLLATPSQGGCVTDGVGHVICDLQTITNGTTASISVLVNAGSAGILTNVALVGAFSPDPNLADNTAMSIDSVVTSFNFVVTPAGQDFGAIATGATAQATFVVTNGSGVTLNGTASVGGAPFAIVSGSPFSVASLGSTNVIVNFAPSSVGSFTDQVIFVTNNGDSTNGVVGAGAILPIASFTGTPTAGLVPLTVTFTDASTGTITNRSWSFGDGGTTNTPNTTVVYTYNSVGTDTVVLVVSGPAGSSTAFSRLNYITVTNIPPLLVVSPGNRNFSLLPVGQSSTQTFSVVNAGVQTLVGTATGSGAPFTVVGGNPFNVNSGQTGLVSVSFSPLAAGTFTGAVVFAGNGGTSTNAVTGSSAFAPTAAFSGSPTTGAVTLVVNFTDTSSGTVTSQFWAFGDGGTSTMASPSHSYTNAGSFPVSLTVLGPLGSNTLTLANYITVTNVLGAPVAAFNANPLNGPAPLLVNFTDASTGSITNHFWTFGDGGTSTLASPSHTYSTVNVYSVSLTVSGPGGSSITNRQNLITVTNAVHISPTVTIVRPANGMLYPVSYTNQTITMVVSATPNDNSIIGAIQFFDGSTLLGQATNSPGTNFFVPHIGTNVLSARAFEILGTTGITTSTIIFIGAKNSPLGDWEVTVTGGDKGAQFLTFEDDFSASGFGIRLKTFGLDDVSGHWGFTTNNPKGQVTGPFIGQTGSTNNWTGVFKGPAKSSKTLSGAVPTTAFGTFHWSGVPATTFPDLSGTWTGLVTVVRVTPAPVSYVLTTNANDSAVFDIAASTDPSTMVGQLLVTSRNKVYMYVTVGGNRIELSGTFSAARKSLTLRGKDAAGEAVSIKISK